MQKWTLGIVLFSITFLLGQASSMPVSVEKDKLVDNIDELERLYPPAEVCASCHGDVYEQWKNSMHSQSILHSIDIIYSYIKNAIPNDPERSARAKKPGGYKAELMKCFVCHAPQLEQASEKFMREVAQAVIDYYEKKDSKAKNLLERLTVTCYVCHNMKALHPPERPEPNVMYSTKGRGQSPFHDIKKHPYIGNSNFCMQCHGAYLAPDGEPIFCSTIAQSYRDHYVAMGGQLSCQDCHMRAKSRGHTFPGTYVIDMLKEGIGLNVQVRSVVEYKPFAPITDYTKRNPAAVITVDLINNAGHRIPDGCYWTSKLILELVAFDEKGRVVWRDNKEYFEIGLDWYGNRRFVSYEIKDLVDFSLPPREITTERFYAIFPQDVKKVELIIRVKYYIKPGVEFLVHEEKRTLEY